MASRLGVGGLEDRFKRNCQFKNGDVERKSLRFWWKRISGHIPVVHTFDYKYKIHYRVKGPCVILNVFLFSHHSHKQREDMG